MGITIDIDLSGGGAPSGPAGGELSGTYPNPTVNDGADGTAIHSGDSAGGDLNGTYPNPTVIDGNIDHDALLNFLIAQHRIINDSGTSVIELLSSSAIRAMISAVSGGVDLKDPVSTSTEGLGNITLSGEQTLNGVTTSVSRVAVIEQTLPEDNGFYLTDPGGWSRTSDADTDAEVSNGMTTFVDDAASTVFRHRYLLTSPNPITVGTTPLIFAVLPAVSFGTTAGTATEGNDSRVPTQDENDALIGTDGTPSSINRYVTDSDPRIDDPTSQSTTVGGTTTTTESAYDFAGGTTIMSGMTLSAVPAGNYLLFFNTSVSHSDANDIVSATIEVNGSQITNAEVDWKRGGSQGDIIAQLCFVGFPITLGSTQDINIHWIEVTGGTATARERSLSIIKVS